MKKWALMFSICFALLPGCSLKADKNMLNEPPLPKILAGEQSIPVLHGSYCWQTGSKGKCVDMASPDEIMKNKALVTVSKGQKAVIDFGNHPPLSPVTEVTLWQGGPRHIVLQEANVMELPEEEGVYIYSFSGSWKQGSSAFVFQVKVE